MEFQQIFSKMFLGLLTLTFSVRAENLLPDIQEGTPYQDVKNTLLAELRLNFVPSIVRVFVSYFNESLLACFGLIV